MLLEITKILATFTSWNPTPLVNSGFFYYNMTDLSQLKQGITEMLQSKTLKK